MDGDKRSSGSRLIELVSELWFTAVAGFSVTIGRLLGSELPSLFSAIDVASIVDRSLFTSSDFILGSVVGFRLFREK